MQYSGEALHPAVVSFRRLKPNLFCITVKIGDEEIVFRRTLEEFTSDVRNTLAAYNSEPEEPE